MIRVFLSASVPLPNRDPTYLATADVVGIREAVKALVAEVAQKDYLVFGGHPAITPLVAMLLRGLSIESQRRVVLYQSAFYSEEFVSQNDQFIELRLIHAVNNSQARSIAEMRKRMIGETKFDVGVFIGGMEGVIREYELFKIRHHAAKIWPIASTGAAAKILFDKLDSPRPDLFLNEITYPTLFRKLLSELN
jgi:hypothetical protein